MKAIITYSASWNDQHSEYPIYSRVDFTADNILKIREITGCPVIITDLEADASICCYYYEGMDIQESLDNHHDPETMFLTSFTEEELIDMSRNPKNYIVIEIYNGYRE